MVENCQVGRGKDNILRDIIFAHCLRRSLSLKTSPPSWPVKWIPAEKLSQICESRLDEQEESRQEEIAEQLARFQNHEIIHEAKREQASTENRSFTKRV